MNKKVVQEKALSANGITLLFMMIYMISYMTRVNFGAIVTEMEKATQIPKDLLSLSLTGSFVTYGVGQIISGICGDKFSPKKLVSIGLTVTIVMNILLPFCMNPYQMLGVWSINGFAQAFMWPPLVRLMSVQLTSEEYKRAVVKVSWGSSFGSIAVYLLAPLVITWVGWKAVFWLFAAMGILGLVLWNFFCADVFSVPVVKGQKQKSSMHIFTPLMFVIMLAIVLQGMMRDGVTTWVPSLVSEVYNLGSTISILTGVILPIFAIVSFQAAAWLYRRIINPLTCACVIFGFGAVAAGLLFIFTGTTAILSVLFAALLTGAMHGVNLILISMLPPFFKKQGKAATVSGVLNACTYIGSAISTYGVAKLSSTIGWNKTILVWVLITVVGTVLCGLCATPWKRTHSSVDE